MTDALLDSPLYKVGEHSLKPEERVQITVRKAQKLAEAYGLSLEDISSLSPKFWAFHTDPIVCDNPATIVMMSIQYNLVLGTILEHVGQRADLRSLLADLLAYRVSGQFCLTELDHGLDAANLETRAEMLEDGSGFILNTPHPGAAKYMPPVTPCGIPCVGVVMARLIKNKKDLGVRPFLVNLTNGEDTLAGVVTRVLPDRGGSSPVWHSITSFHNLYLPASALLMPDHRSNTSFQKTIWRVAVGSLSLSATAIPALAHGATIAAKYSQRRLVTGGKPVIAFPTQHGPILEAFAQHFVLGVFYQRAAMAFMRPGLSMDVRHGIATCFKAVATRDGQNAMLKLSERCGAQGLFNYNGLSQMHADLRGNAVAEGDILVLSIRLVTELLLGRYALDEVFFSGLPVSLLDNPLTRHAEGLLSTARSTLFGPCKGVHRSEEFARRILPQCTKIVEAIGMSYAYVSAVSAGLDERITGLYLAVALREDQGWYIEHLGLTQGQLLDGEVSAVKEAFPLLGKWMAMCGAEKYVKAPIVDKQRWDDFVGSLKVFNGSEGYVGNTPLFKRPTHSLKPADSVILTVKKAQKLAEVCALTLNDIASLSPKFWEFHMDPIFCTNFAPLVLLAIQFNTVVGTILDHVGQREDLKGVLQDLLAYRVSGLACITEIDHGLDAPNLETTAEMLEDMSGFVLNTPHPGAAKYMSAMAPSGIPSVAVVFARLLKHKQDLGVRPFLVSLTDGLNVLPGVVIRILPFRGGSEPLQHCIISFENLHLPAAALLTKDTEQEADFHKTIWRAAVGSISFSATTIPALAHSAFIAAKYSQRRLSAGQPIINFPTQHGPILEALAQHFVLKAFYQRATSVFVKPGLDMRVRHGISVSFKAVAMKDALAALYRLSERCGAQGLFSYNTLSQLHIDLRGNAIAEGDILVLSIRLATELILKRYELDSAFLPGLHTPDNPLAHHAKHLLVSARATLAGPCKGAHRSIEFAQRVLPQCAKIVEAIGMHYAYASAVSAGLDKHILKLYLASAMREDQGWYIEHLGFKREQLLEQEVTAVQEALPMLDEWLRNCGAAPYVTAPIVDEGSWNDFLGSLVVLRGNSKARL
ncbi:Acyl-CoA dehydrogenase NM domain-like protein [Mycena indigotica]|uniref:Acyl-CoA dehydrogenase NM domain-like protein n=1 Tax=Mycena indigotica TaxID=2126181 RepID=A0A8H6TC40_9AGAR|nr:Acyl-CoA dehydrogenase NM domain-like protein [Mycena indigotica]KAF7314963.1 Acyl-CoA dehydrogenase NM domain-like protein [Mycena indigotica]